MNELLDFIQSRMGYLSREKLESAVQEHMKYGTMTVIGDENGIVGFVRFNVIGECADILDLAVREDMEKKNVIKQLSVLTWNKFPYLQFFSFKRKRKYGERPIRAYRINRLLANKES